MWESLSSNPGMEDTGYDSGCLGSHLEQNTCSEIYFSFYRQGNGDRLIMQEQVTSINLSTLGSLLEHLL